MKFSIGTKEFRQEMYIFLYVMEFYVFLKMVEPFLSVKFYKIKKTAHGKVWKVRHKCEEKPQTAVMRYFLFST
jgi:hypothetical protein